jgi:peroxin-12
MNYWQGSFTENFYGLKRVTQTPLSDSKYKISKLTQLVPSMIEDRMSLSGLQRFASIFEITGVSFE